MCAYLWRVSNASRSRLVCLSRFCWESLLSPDMLSTVKKRCFQCVCDRGQVAYEKGRPPSLISPRFSARWNLECRFVRAVIPELLMIFLFKTKERAVRSDSHLPRRRDHHLSFKRSPNAIIFVGDKKSHFAAENFSFYRKVLSSSTNFAVPLLAYVHGMY